MRRVVKVLVVPNDAGEVVGDNWLLASLGENEDCKKVYLVTDSAHASEYGGYPEIRVDEMATICANAINEAIGKREQA